MDEGRNERNKRQTETKTKIDIIIHKTIDAASTNEERQIK